MKRELLQIGADAESLIRYIRDHGDESDARIIHAQIRLLNIHSGDLEASVVDGKTSSDSAV